MFSEQKYKHIFTHAHLHNPFVALRYILMFLSSFFSILILFSSYSFIPSVLSFVFIYCCVLSLNHLTLLSSQTASSPISPHPFPILVTASSFYLSPLFSSIPFSSLFSSPPFSPLFSSPPFSPSLFSLLPLSSSLSTPASSPMKHRRGSHKEPFRRLPMALHFCLGGLSHVSTRGRESVEVTDLYGVQEKREKEAGENS